MTSVISDPGVFPPFFSRGRAGKGPEVALAGGAISGPPSFLNGTSFSPRHSQSRGMRCPEERKFATEPVGCVLSATVDVLHASKKVPSSHIIAMQE